MSEMPEDIPEDITIPPPAIKEIIHKTAGYVVRNGRDFENKIRENESSNKQFTFINEKDSYHKYYLYVLENIKDFDQVEDANAQDTDSPEDDEDEEVVVPEELGFLVSLPSITVKDLEIIKLTALFVAKNGDDYVNSIRSKYQDQIMQFSFLNNDHSFNDIYLRYLRQYRDLINGTKPKLINDNELLEACAIRAKFNIKNKSKEIKLRKLEALKKEKLASIDWQDSIIVETIEFTELDAISDLPAPFTVSDLQFRSLEAKSKEVTAIAPPSDDKSNSKMKIREYGTTRLQRGSTNGNGSKEKLIECPITGKMIPESNFERHIQILLRDPKYKEEKASYESKIKNSNLSTVEVVDNIKNLFKPSDQANKRQKVQWDGYNSSVKFIQATNTATKEDLEEYKRKKEEHNKIGPQPRPN